ncbi:hypothetical protein CsSME_00029263 [Camellia sinensis var. sinensis]
MCSNNHPGSSDGGFEQQHFWKKLWYFRIPNKIKFFAWRASLNIIPTSDLLRRRHVSVAGNCVLCPNCPETLLHCVRDCHVAKQVWELSPLRFEVQSWNCTDFSQWVSVIGNRVDEYGLGLFFSLCWGLWSARNQAIFNEVVHSAEDIVLWVCELLHDFSLANHRPISAPVFEDPVCWVAPIDGFYKVNFDGAVFNHLMAVGVGVIIRDHAGAVIAALSERIDCWGDANCAEAFPVQRAVHFAMDLGILDVHLEGDSLNIIRALQAADPLLCSYGHVLQDAIAKGRCFLKWNVSHTPRLGNRVAHSLAQ